MGKKKGGKHAHPHPKKEAHPEEEDLAQDAQGGSAVPEDPEKVVMNDVKDSTPVEEEQQAVGAEDAAAPVADEEPPADDATPEAEKEDSAGPEEGVPVEPAAASTPVEEEEPVPESVAPDTEEVAEPAAPVSQPTQPPVEVTEAQQEEEPAVVVDAEEKEEAAPEVSVGTEQPEVVTSTTTTEPAAAVSSPPSEPQQDAEEEEQPTPAPEVVPTPSAAPVEPIDVGEEVETTWGSGIVKAIREDGFYVVEAERWRLANNQIPTLYLQRKDVQKITPYVIWQWKTSKKLSRASYLKEKGNELFKTGDLEGAERKYADAVGVLQLTVDDNMTNREKAQKLEILLPILNNAGVVRLKLSKFHDALTASRSVYMLIEELGKNKSGQVLAELRNLGCTDDQIFVKQRKKAGFVCGKAAAQMQEYDEAISFFEVVKSLVQEEGDVELKSTDGREVQRLLSASRERKAKQDKAEKDKWSKTFAKFSSMEEEEDKDDKATTTSTTTTKAAAAATPAAPAPAPVKKAVTPAPAKVVKKSRTLSSPDDDAKATGGGKEMWLALAGLALAAGLGIAVFLGAQKQKGGLRK